MADEFGLEPIPGLGRLNPDNTALLVLNGPLTDRRFPLHQLRTVIGRDDPPQITVDLDLSACELGEPPAISRRHAVLQWIKGELQIIDLASRNGTFVDGQQIVSPNSNQPSAPFLLKAGSKLKLGNLELEVITYG